MINISLIDIFICQVLEEEVYTKIIERTLIKHNICLGI